MTMLAKINTKFKRALRNEKGFTLIELIMVIVILGILAAAAVPKFMDLSSDAKIASMKGVAGALEGGCAQNFAKRSMLGATPTQGPFNTATAAQLAGTMATGTSCATLFGSPVTGGVVQAQTCAAGLGLGCFMDSGSMPADYGTITFAGTISASASACTFVGSNSGYTTVTTFSCPMIL